jgi:hypothetical protein
VPSRVTLQVRVGIVSPNLVKIVSICCGICRSDGLQYGAFRFCFYLAAVAGLSPNAPSSDTRVFVNKIDSDNSNNTLCSLHLP